MVIFDEETTESSMDPPPRLSPCSAPSIAHDFWSRIKRKRKKNIVVNPFMART
jgi:hypothetical protein